MATKPKETRLWVPDEAQIWRLAWVISRDDAKGTVTVDAPGGKSEDPVEVKISDTHVYDDTHGRDLDDAADLNNLHEGPLLHLILSRFKKDKIYTNVGGVLISVNPYKFIPNLYTLQRGAAAATAAASAASASSGEGGGKGGILGAQAAKDELPPNPHCYAIAHQALDSMASTLVGNVRNQSVVISGESGAGKTEASKHVMRYLINQSMKLHHNTEPKAPSRGGDASPPAPSRDRGGPARGPGQMGRVRSSSMSMHAVDPTPTKGSTDIESRLMQSNIILEAFGNAKTVRNDNSSRFGKYIKLQYNQHGRMMQANTLHFLLEKSRLVSVASKERNYHVFYELIEGLQHKAELLEMDDPEAFDDVEQLIGMLALENTAGHRLTNMGKCLTVSEEVDDAVDFVNLETAMHQCNISTVECECVWSLIAALIHLGNANVVPHPENGEEYSKVVGTTMSTQRIAELLGLEDEELQEACTLHELNNSAAAGGKIQVPLSNQQVMDAVEALIKYVYSELFSWLVGKINQAHNRGNQHFPTFIGILDIFGFEVMKKNSFEQLCINFTNEVLQQQFNQHIFVLEQDIYTSEGLDFTQISFHDNQPVIDLIGKKPNGLLPICEEHVLLAGKRSTPPDNGSLLQTYHKRHEKNANYEKPRFKGPEFIIHHFAGPVTYNITGFIEKNKDSLNEELKEMLRHTTKPFITCLFGRVGDRNPAMPGFLPMPAEEAADEEDDEDDEGSRRRSRRSVRKSMAVENTKGTITSAYSVSLRFRDQLVHLTETLRATQPHYIKCIKPNNVKAAGAMSPHLISQQLRYSGVLEVIRIRREAYPVRIIFLDLHEMFKVVIRSTANIEPPSDSTTVEESRSACEALTAKYLDSDQFQIGRTKVFLRHAVLELLQGHQEAFFSDMCTVIQSRYRTFVLKRWYLQTRVKIVRIQALIRMFVSKCMLKNFLRNLIKVQSAVRRHQALVSYRLQSSARRIQAVVRMFVRRRRYNREKVTVVVLQRYARGMVVRNHYGKHADRRRAAILVQCHIRKFIHERKFAREFAAKRTAVTKLSAQARRRIAVKAFQRHIRATIMFQCTFRAFTARRLHATLKTQDRLRREKERKKATMIQAQARRRKLAVAFQAKRTVSTRLANLHRRSVATRNFSVARRSAIRIQCLVRKTKARRRMLALKAAIKRAYRKALAAAIKIQAQIRCFIATTKQRRRNKAVRRMQRAAKAYILNERLYQVMVDVHDCASAGDVASVRRLQDADTNTLGYDTSDIRFRYKDFRTILHSCVESGSLVLVTELQPEPHEILIRDKDGNTALHFAAKTLNVNLVKYLVHICLPLAQVDADAVNQGIVNTENRDARVHSSSQAGAPAVSKSKRSSIVGMMATQSILTRIQGGAVGSGVYATKEVRAGFLKKRRETDRFRRRWCVLRPASLEYYETKSANKPSLTIPLDGAMLKRCEDMDFTFEINAPVLKLNKKNKEGRLYFQADDEISFNEWFTDMMVVCGRTEFSRTERTTPMSFVNTNARKKLLMDVNKRGETMLHCACYMGGRVADTNSFLRMSSTAAAHGSTSTSLQTVIWLVENGCDVNTQDVEGYTALHRILEEDNEEAAMALIHKGTDTSLKTNEGQSALDLCSDEIVQKLTFGQFKQTDLFPLLDAPDRVINCSYVSLLVEKSTMASTEQLQRPYLTLTVYKVGDHKHDVAELSQSIREPVVKRPDHLWWGSTWHMQSPLENLSSGAIIVLELKDAGDPMQAMSPSKSQKGAQENAAPVAWTLIDVSKQSIDTADNAQLEMYEYPVDLRRSKLTPADMFLSVDVMLTRVESDDSVPGLAPVAVDFSVGAKLEPMGAGKPLPIPEEPSAKEENTAEAEQPQTAEKSGSGDIASKLKKLAELKQQGLLSEEEFAAAKKKAIEESM